MLKEAIEHLLRTGEEKKPVCVVHTDPAHTVYVVDTGKPEQPRELVDIQHCSPKLGHVLTSVSELLRFMAGRECDGTRSGAVFVGTESVRAVFQYGAHQESGASVPLVWSAEMKSLLQTSRGLGQRELWRLLITDLADAFPESLSLAIANLRCAGTSDAAATIDVTGVSNSDSRRALTVSWCDAKETKRQPVPVDWKWTGRLWEAHDEQTTIDVRLEIDEAKGGLCFYLHPRYLDRVVRDARTRLVDHMRQEVERLGITDRFSVYEDKY